MLQCLGLKAWAAGEYLQPVGSRSVVRLFVCVQVLEIYPSKSLAPPPLVLKTEVLTAQ